jgi:hypothetical protein
MAAAIFGETKRGVEVAIAWVVFNRVARQLLPLIDTALMVLRTDQ